MSKIHCLSCYNNVLSFWKGADIPYLVMGSITSTGFYYNIYQRFIKFVSSIQHPNFIAKNVITPSSWKACKMAAMSRKTTTRTYYRLHWSCHNNEVNGNIFITLIVYVKHMKKSKWLDCQGNEFFPKQKGTPSLVKIEHKNTATLDLARSKKNLKSQFCN